MMPPREGLLSQVLRTHEDAILTEWLKEQSTRATRRDQLNETQLRTTSREFLRAVVRALADGNMDTRSAAWGPVRDVLADISASRAHQGYSPTDTAVFVFSLKRPVFMHLRGEVKDAIAMAEAMWDAT